MPDQPQQGPANNIQEIYYNDLTRGWGPREPARSMNEKTQKIWRSINNILPMDGNFRIRPVIASLGASAIGTGGVFPPPLGFLEASIKNSGEIPVFVYSQTTPKFRNDATNTGTCAQEHDITVNSVAVIVTTKRILTGQFKSDGTLIQWIDCTPIYNTGTLTVTNGSKIVTGAGTLWQTNGISPYQEITFLSGPPAGVTTQICSVTDDTHMVVGSAAYTGSTTAGVSYQIGRTWSGGASLYEKSLIYCAIFNEDLYVAGTYLGAADGSASPAVIKVGGALTGLSPGAAGTYLTAKTLLSPGLDNIATLDNITGLQLLQDGRVVITGNDARVLYSSHLNQTVWNTTPGGFTDVTILPGAITALGNMGSSLTLHYAEGVVLAYPTGEADPPLTYQRSRARVGCLAPRTLKFNAGTERYLGSDLNVHEFNGFYSQPIGDDIRPTVSGYSVSGMRSHMHATVDTYRNEYILLNENYPNTNGWIYNMDLHQWWPVDYPFPIGAMSSYDARAATKATSRVLVGMANYDSGNTTNQNMIWGYSDLNNQDDPTAFTSSTATVLSFITDDLDMGQPTLYKSVQRVDLWFKFPNYDGSHSNSATFTCGVSYNGGTTYPVNLTNTGTGFVSKNFEQVCHFYFDETNPAPVAEDQYPSQSFRLKFTVASSGGAAVAPPLVYVTRFKVFANIGADAEHLGFETGSHGTNFG
jgi:hypothetical protein